MADFIKEGHFQRHLLKMRMRYKYKWEHIIAQCSQQLGQQAQVIAQGAGMHIVVAFNQHDDHSVQAQLQDKGFNSQPLSRYYFGNHKRQGLVLGFANASDQEITQGIKALGKVLNQSTR